MNQFFFLNLKVVQFGSIILRYDFKIIMCIKCKTGQSHQKWQIGDDTQKTHSQEYCIIKTLTNKLNSNNGLMVLSIIRI